MTLLQAEVRERKKEGAGGEKEERGGKEGENRKRRPAEARSRVGGRRHGGGWELSLPRETRKSLGKGLGLPIQTCLVSPKSRFYAYASPIRLAPPGQGLGLSQRLLAPQTGTLTAKLGGSPRRGEYTPCRAKTLQRR